MGRMRDNAHPKGIMGTVATESRLVNAATVAPLTGLTPRALLRLAREGKVPSYRYPGRRGTVRFSVQEIHEWVASHRREATTA
jgi:excisionase family DNA binding protein